MSAGQFKPGSDARRNTAGRPVGSRRLSTMIRAQLGKDAPAIIENARVLALSGDAAATAAVCSLLAAAATSK